MFCGMLEFAMQSLLYESDGISSIFREGLVFIKLFHPSESLRCTYLPA